MPKERRLLFEALFDLPALRELETDSLTDQEKKEIEDAATGAVQDYLIERINRVLENHKE